MTERGHAPWEVLLFAVEVQDERTAVRSAEGDRQADAWGSHIAACPECKERMQEILDMLASLREDDAGDAPETWIESAQRRVVPSSYFAPLRGDFTADVVFDSAHQRLVGTRAGSLETRQLLFAWNRLEVELSIGGDGADARWRVSGQLFADEGAPIELGGCRVVLIEGEREVESARTSATGEFLIGARPTSRFHLRIEGDGWTLRTPAIEP
jgi:hypothetical protein